MSESGKRIGRKTYLHIDALALADEELRDLVARAGQLAAVLPQEDYNVVKLDDGDGTLSLLQYSNFDEDAFPVLAKSWFVDLTQGSVRPRTYESSLNPPILHRKELLLPEEHPDRDRSQRLTKAAEQIGLFDDPNRIGFKRAWETLLAQKGYKVVDHDLIPIANDESDAPLDSLSSFERVERHRTALARYGFSAPMQTLARFGYLDGTKSVFDYGCGRGDDLRNLTANNIAAAGWDPHYQPDADKKAADIVNLGFVINVIEDREERAEALRGAYALATELLVVSAMLASQESIKGVPYGDGVLTGRSTFQKYYSQDELRNYISETLQEVPIPVGPGIFYVFKNKETEQRFMYGRFENRRTLLRLAYLSRPPKRTREDRALAKFNEHEELLESLWERCLELGRPLEADEFSRADEIKKHFGGMKAAIRFLLSLKQSGDTYLEQARSARIEDLTVYFAQMQFEKKKPYRQLERQLQRDVKAFFGDYKAATAAGRDLLFRLADPQVINKACALASERGIGWYEDSESLQLHTSLVSQLPPELRAYVACGTALYGDVTSADLIKIHIRSSKLTLMTFDDFPGKPLPRMLERVKIKLRDQDIDYFVYGEQFEPPFLYRKSRYINEEFPNYAEQLAFDLDLEKLFTLDAETYGPAPADLLRNLDLKRREIQGFAIVPSRTVPDLDVHCGKYLTYRALIECGETQQRLGIKNLPENTASYTALYELATAILDPVIDYFGAIRLTYGFCSNNLQKEVTSRVAPRLDQHAAEELKRSGKPVCDRLGAAVDFYVEDEDMEEVARWIIDNLPFDRLYYYGRSRPLHVSYAAPGARAAYRMVQTEKGGSIPIPFSR